MSDPDLDRWVREVETQSKGHVLAGLGLTVLLHLFLQVPAFFIVGSLINSEEGLMWLFYVVEFVGLSQLVYMIPAILIFRRKGRTETVKGLIIGGSLTFLLNAACDGLMFFSR